MSGENDVLRYRIIVLGAGGVGKSAITIRYCENTFRDVYDPTVEDSFTRFLHYDNKKTKPEDRIVEDVELEIVDTAGYDQFQGFREIQLKEADGLIIVVSLDSAESFRMARTLLREILRGRDETVRPNPVMVLCNKTDLTAREVNLQQAEELMNDFKVRVILTSARLGKGISEAFYYFTGKLIDYNPKPSVRTVQKKKSRNWWRKFSSKSQSQ